MNRETFLARLEALGLNQAKFSRETGIHAGTVYHWGGAGGPFPQWVTTLLNAWEDNRAKHSALIVANIRDRNLSERLAKLEQFAP